FIQGAPRRITPPPLVSLRQWVGDAERSPVALEPLPSLHAHFLQRLQRFFLRRSVSPLLKLDDQTGGIERVGSPEQHPQQPLLFCPHFHHCLLPRQVSKRLEWLWRRALCSHGLSALLL